MAKENPLIIGFVADLIFGSRIEAVAGKLGYTVEWIAAAGELGSAEKTRPPW